jgi:hypothetical protein
MVRWDRIGRITLFEYEGIIASARFARFDPSPADRPPTANLTLYLSWLSKQISIVKWETTKQKFQLHTTVSHFDLFDGSLQPYNFPLF